MSWRTPVTARGDSFDARVEIVKYDPAWPAAFEREKALLEGIIGQWLAGGIEHVGSTAVPGLAAKPVIDMMAPVASLGASRQAIVAAGRAGYCHWPHRADEMHWFCKPSPSCRTHHLHLVPLASRLWIERLAFRDALRDDQALASEYAELKKRLARKFPLDREAYTAGKGSFVGRVLSAAGFRDGQPPLSARTG